MFIEQLLKNSTPYHHISSISQYFVIQCTDGNNRFHRRKHSKLCAKLLSFKWKISQMVHQLKVESLFSYLRCNPSIWGVAHIPLLLELICSLWSNQDSLPTEQLTMTRLYTEMTEWLCRRYLTTQNNQIPQLSQHEIDESCQKELAFLETLAFHAIQRNIIIIQPTLLEKALQEAKISSQQHPHILNIGILKSFHKQGIGNRLEMKKDHYFVHLSFQEYFAARYLTNALRRTSTETSHRIHQMSKIQSTLYTGIQFHGWPS